MRARILAVGLVVAATLGYGAQTAHAEESATEESATEVSPADVELATTFAPQVMLVAQSEPCGPGEPYEPSDVEPLFDNMEIALRGPWSTDNLVDAGASRDDIAQGLRGYQLDFPGDALRPGCDYEQWANRTWAGHRPVVYAHVATQAGVSDRLAVQYWFFYPYNDYNNKHEGDWERIQLDFPAGDAATILADGIEPQIALYSQHNGSERAEWGSSRMEIVDDTHPVVYVSAGSHASKFTSGIFLGASAATGFGCDTTVGPHDELDPVLTVLPTKAAPGSSYDWLNYQGLWGEAGPLSFYNGPTGPAMKTDWTRPFVRGESARTSSFQLPGSAVAGSRGAQFYCDMIGKSSDVLRTFFLHPGAVALGLLALTSVLILAWRLSDFRAPVLPLARRRRFSQVIYSSLELLKQHWRHFLSLAAPGVVIGAISGLVHTEVLLDNLPTWLWGAFALVLGVTLLVTATAVTVATVAIGRGEPVSTRRAFALGAARLGVGAPAVALIVVALLIAVGTVVLAPLALVVLMVGLMFTPVSVAEERSWWPSLRRSLRLALRGWRTTLPLVLAIALLVTTAGAVFVALLFVATPLPFVAFNAVSLVVLALVWPLAATMGVYAYHSALLTTAQPVEPATDPMPA